MSVQQEPINSRLLSRHYHCNYGTRLVICIGGLEVSNLCYMNGLCGLIFQASTKANILQVVKQAEGDTISEGLQIGLQHFSFFNIFENAKKCTQIVNKNNCRTYLIGSAKFIVSPLSSTHVVEPTLSTLQHILYIFNIVVAGYSLYFNRTFAYETYYYGIYFYEIYFYGSILKKWLLPSLVIS